MHKSFVRLFALIYLLFTYPSVAQTGLQLPIKFQSFVQELEIQKNELQGGAIAILHEGKVVYKTTFGYQKGNEGVITSATLFPLASLSKPVSAMAIALLVDKGDLSFDDEFKLPYLRNPVNLSNILSHTTGYQFSGNTQIEQGMTRAKLLEILQKQPPKCDPGQCYHYSNTIFSLLEEALNQKKLSFKMAIDNMRTTLKTKDIAVLPLPQDVSVAYPHLEKTADGIATTKPLPFPPYYPKTVPASAGVFASIDGMVEVFKISFGYRPDLVSDKTLSRIFTPVTSNTDVFNWHLVNWPVDEKIIESYYALGWRVLKIKGQPEKDLIFHGGHINGINAFIGYVPSTKMGFIMLANQNTNIPIEYGLKFWGVALSNQLN